MFSPRNAILFGGTALNGCVRKLTQAQDALLIVGLESLSLLDKRGTVKKWSKHLLCISLMKNYFLLSSESNFEVKIFRCFFVVHLPLWTIDDLHRMDAFGGQSLPCCILDVQCIFKILKCSNLWRSLSSNEYYIVQNSGYRR